MEGSAGEPPGGTVLAWLRSHVRSLAIIAGLLLLYTLAGFLLLPRIARNQAIAYVEHDLHRQLAIGALSFNPFSLALEIRDLALTEADGSPIASLALLRVQFSATASLLHRAWTFAEVRLEQPVVSVLVYKDGSLNLAKLAPPEPPKPPEEPASVPALRLGSFTVTGGQVHFEDRSRGQPFTATLTPIEFALTDFRTQLDFENRYRFSAATSAGEQLAWSGQFSVRPLGSNGEFSISALKAATIASYLEDSLPFALPSGSIDLNGSYRLVATGETSLSLTLPSVKVHALAIAPKDSPAPATPWIELPELDVADTAIDLSQRRVGIGQVTLQKPSLQLWREADGSLNLQRLLAPAAPQAQATPAASEPAAAAAPTASTAPAAPVAQQSAWSITLARLAIDGASIAAEDRSVKPAIQLVIAPLTLTVQNYSSAGVQPLTLALDTGLGATGRLQVGGTLALTPLNAAMTVDLKQFDLPPLQPYVAQYTDMTIYRGRLASQLQVAYAATPSKGQPQLKLNGAIQLTDLATRDNPTGSDFITWKALQVTGLRYQLAPDALEIDQVRASSAYCRVIVGPNGGLNVSEILRPAGSAPPRPAPGTPAAAKPAKAAPRGTPATQTLAARPATAPAGLPVSIKRVLIHDGAADFTDHSVQPNFSAAILGLNGSITGLSSDPASRAQVTLDGAVDRYAPVSIKGQLSPFAPMAYTDLALGFHNIELTTFNPYSGKFAGYNIAQGKLSTDLHYHIENRKLDASHHVVIDQLEFGPATESKQAVPLPVKLAAALLKDRHGVIDLELPVSGSVDDPSFRIGPVIWKVVVNLITKIVTAPFAMLGSLFGGGEQLAYIDFPAGSAQMSDAEAQKLPKLAKALMERPQLKLDIPLHTISALDDDALARAALEQALASAAANAKGGKRAAAAQAAAGAAAGGAPQAAPTAAQTPAQTAAQLHALAALYRQSFQTDPVYPAEVGGAGGEPAKPGSAAAQAADAARIAWLQQELLVRFRPTHVQRDALGLARAKAAQAALLTGQELPPERVFLTERESGGGADVNVRMEMKLQ